MIIGLSATLALFLFSCNPAKKLAPGQFLLDRVELHNHKETRIPKEEFESYYRQKPNRKLFRKIPMAVWWYNKFDNEKIARKRVARNQKYDRKNAEKVKRFEEKNLRRAKKGKKPKIPKLKDKESSTFLESLRDIGEAPVVLDSLRIAQTRYQLSLLLFSRGYFNNVVTDSVELNRRGKKATLHYFLYPGDRYRVNAISYDIADKAFENLLMGDTANSRLKVGRSYNANRLQEERDRITNLARNNGYYYFDNAYVSYEIDSSLAGHLVNMTVTVNQFNKPASSSNDSLIQVDHTRYTIENVYMITEPVIGNVRDAQFTDTLKAASKGIIFLLNKPLPYREFMLVDNIDVYKGQVFRKDSAQQTYRQLLGLGIFKNVIIHFLPNPDRRDRLDCYIVGSPMLRQALTAETEGTNTSGNLGIDVSLVYQNRNTFRAGELVELKIQGSIVAQQQLNASAEEESGLGQFRSFNTIQIGPELTFSVPRAFFPFSLIPFRRDMSPRTYLKASLNYQSRPDFSRVINAVDYGFNFKTHGNKIKHNIIPLEIYFVHAKLTEAFKSDLRELNDAYLVNSFQDHATTLSRYSLTYFSQENTNNSRKPVSYIHWSIQSSGSLLRKIFDLTGREKDSLGSYHIFGIPFAQFVRTNIDYRIYIPIRRRSRVVYRVAGGVGFPLANLSVLPYEQSFFSGGPNGVRAWRARTLGPGAYDPRQSTARYDKTGDILLEGNFEYRFHVIKAFHGAFFVDAGNIWRHEADDSKPGAKFEANLFLDQIAIGTGLGVRWDLEFFVMRIDFAMPIKDPSYPVGQRWMFDKAPWNSTVFNFGIGYPF